MLTRGTETELREWSRDGAWPEMEPDSSRAEIGQQHCRGPAAAGPEIELWHAGAFARGGAPQQADAAARGSTTPP